MKCYLQYFLKKMAPILVNLLMSLLFCPRASSQRNLVNLAPDFSFPEGSNPTEFGSNKVFAFFRTGQYQGNEFWRTDGTKKGTIRLLPGEGFKRYYGLPEEVSWNGLYFFTGWDPKAGWELFRTDGSLKGTQLVADLYPGDKAYRYPFSSNPRLLTVSGNYLYFVATTTLGETLFKSDGTTKGTMALFSTLGKLKNLTALGKKLVFEISGNPPNQNGLAVSDGSPKGTHFIFKPYTLGGGRGGRSFATLGKNLFFSASLVAYGKGEELFISDGTTFGTYLLKDLWPGSKSSKPTNFIRAGNRIFFSAEDSTHGRELWSTNGTALGTSLVKDINPGKSRNSPLSSRPSNLKSFGTKVLFKAETGKSGEEPWISDGTSKGTFLLQDIQVGIRGSKPSAFTSIGSIAFFFTHPTLDSFSLYKTNGTTTGTQLVTKLGLKEPLWPTPTITPYGNRILFPNWDKNHGLEPWISDGTKQGTQLLLDIASKRFQAYGSKPRDFKTIGESLFFIAKLQGKPSQLWESDITGKSARPLLPFQRMAKIQIAGNRILWMDGAQRRNHLIAYDPKEKKTVSLLKTPNLLSPLYPLGDQWLFFETFVNTKVTKTWATDGTKSGTRLLSWLPTLAPGATVTSIPFGRRTLLVGPINYYKSQKAFSIWLTDGTKKGSRWLTTITSPFPVRQVEIRGWAPLGKDLIFPISLYLQTSYTSSEYKSLLIRTDGTPSKTKILKRFDHPLLSQFGSLGSKVVFTNADLLHASEVWVTDGTTQGTKLLKDLTIGSRSSQPAEFTRVQNRIVFRATTPNTGKELFVTDGTSKGTKLLKDIWPGKWDGISFYPRFFRLGSRHVGFLADDGIKGMQIWITDGTPSGTKPASSPLKDFETNKNRIMAYTFALGRLFFSWNTKDLGEEPWVWFPGASSRAYGFGCGSGPRLEASDPILGKTMSFGGNLPSTQPLGVILFGLTAPTPVRMEGGCMLHVDPYRLIVQVPVRAKFEKWDLRVPVPNQPSLEGLQFQAQVVHPLKAGGFELSNPIECVLGN